jgi:hypothetical protein
LEEEFSEKEVLATVLELHFEKTTGPVDLV